MGPIGKMRLQPRIWGGEGGRLVMRLAAIACALIMVLGAAVFGVILAQRSPLPIGTPTPAEASAATETTARSVVTTLQEPAVMSAVTGVKPAAEESKPAAMAQV